MKRVLVTNLVYLAILIEGLNLGAATDSPAPTATPAAPPAAIAQRSAAELEKLAAPIALYPDPLIAIILPAAVFPVEIVQAARFVNNTNNLPKVDQQPWDDKVKQVAKFPEVIAKMDAELGWTVDLGKAFLEQPMDLMNAVQKLRAKAVAAGKLKSSPQQVVTTTNAVVERTYENQVVYVTNTVIQVQPASQSIIYVPSYRPSVVYVDDDDDAAAFISFGVGMAFGAAMWGHCDWHYGGCYWGHYPPPPPPYPPPYHPPPGARPPPSTGRPPGSAPPGNRPPGTQPPGARPPTATTLPAQRWQPDQSRLNSSGGASAATREARGWGGSSTQPAQRPATGSAGASRPAQQPTYNWSQKPATPSAQPARGSGAGQPSPAARSGQTSSFNRPASQPSSAFSGLGSGGTTRDYSSRGASSRSAGGGGRSMGGGRGGGGRGR